MLEGCGNLVEIHQSIGHLDRLVFLNLKDCKNLKSLPSSICNLKYLENLILSGCSKLDKLPEHLGNMTCLTELLADGTTIKQLPFSIGLLNNLRSLSLRGCTGSPSKSWHSFFSSFLSLRKAPINLLPASISGLCSLRRLELSDCNLSEGAIPSDFGSLSSLEVLNLCGNNFSSLPESISGLSQLRELWLNRCSKLQSIPELPSSLNRLYANDCSSMERISILLNEYLWILGLANCNKLVEIQGFDKWKYLPIINLENCTDLAKIFKNSVLQGLYERTCLHAHLPWSEVPEWCEYQSIGSTIFFDVPSSNSDYKFQWLTVCAVYGADKEYNGPAVFTWTVVKFKTNGLDLCQWEGPLYGPETCQDHVWVNHILDIYLETPIKGGDQVVVSFNTEKPVVVKWCGVHLVYKSNDAAMIRYTTPSNENLSVDDGDVDKSVNNSTGAKRYPDDDDDDDDEAKPCPSSGCCIQDPNPKRLRTDA